MTDTLTAIITAYAPPIAIAASPVLVTPVPVTPVPVVEKSKDVADIKDITEYATARLAALGDATFAADQYEAALLGLKELKKVITGFERLLSRSNAALLDEKALLLKRLEEIQRATNIRVTDTVNDEVKTQQVKPKGVLFAEGSKMLPSRAPAKAPSWADVTEAEERQTHRAGKPAQQSRSRGDSPESFDSSRRTDDFEEPKRRQGNARGGRGRRGVEGSSFSGNRESNTPQHFSDDSHHASGPLSDREKDARRILTRSGVTSKELDEQSNHGRDQRPQEKRGRQGSRIPQMSANPLMLKRRITMDDLEGFSMTIKQDAKYGELVTFATPAHGGGVGEVTIGGIVSIGDRSASRQGMCEPLYYEGMCNCKTTALVLHTGKPLQLSMTDFIGILHKFANNFNGNYFRPSDVSPVHIDAVILRCVVYAIAEIKGFRRGQMTFNLDSFEDVTAPKNLLSTIDDFYKGHNEEAAMPLAKGLFVAIATHFVSS
jgi:hypothetical protein